MSKFSPKNRYSMKSIKQAVIKKRLICERLEDRVTPAQGFDFPREVPTEYPTGLYGSNSTLAEADFDGDGDRDLVTSGNSTVTNKNSVSILRNRGDATFDEPVIYELPAGTIRQLVVGDVDGDGAIDIVAGGYTSANSSVGTVWVLRNEGKGTFAKADSYDIADLNLLSLTVADLNGDGDVEIVTSGYLPLTSKAKISVLPNLGNGTFDTPVNYDAGSSSSYKIEAADVDGDGATDVVTTGYSTSGYATIRVFLNRGDGLLGAAVDHHAADDYAVSDFRAADVDNDGAIDFILAGYYGLSVLRNKGDGTFEAPAKYETPQIYSSKLAVADVDGNGFADLVSTDYYSTEISVFLNRGDGTFNPASNYEGHGNYYGVGLVAADFNGDGTADISNVNNFSVSVLLNNGDGTFPTPVERGYATEESPTQVVAVDVDDDGDADLVGLSDYGSGTVLVLRNRGDGTYDAPAHYGAGKTYPVSLDATDVDRDGAIDIVAAGYSPTSGKSVVWVFRNQGDGTFDDPVEYGVSGNSFEAVSTGDVDADGFIDIVAATANSFSGDGDGLVQVLRNRGDGTFETAVSYETVNGQPHSITVADVDGDGAPELIAAGSESYYGGASILWVFRNLGDGTFETPTVYDTPGGSLTDILATDVNGDGAPDLVAVGSSSGGGSESAAITATTVPVGASIVWVLQNQGDGTFAEAVGYGTGGNDASNLLAEDMDGDGIRDLVVGGSTYYGSSGGAVSVLRGLEDGTFAPPIEYDTLSNYSDVAAADVDGDGVIDLITANNEYGIWVLRNRGDGTFPGRASYPISDEVLSVLTADVDGDGAEDVISISYSYASYGGYVSITPNRGNGVLGSSVDYKLGVDYPYSVAAADVNGDGTPDLVVVTSNGSSVLLNKGNGTFETPVNYSTGSGQAVTLADMDGDGDTDIVVSSYSRVSVLRNLGDGTFGSAESYFTSGNYGSALALADIDGDGATDVITAGSSGSTNTTAVWVARNRGDGTFETPVQYQMAGMNADRVRSGDLDGDGDTDLVTISYSSSGFRILSVLRNEGSGTFSGPTAYVVGNDATDLLLSDIDDDGTVDVITVGGTYSYGVGRVSILRNLGNGTFGLRTDYAAGVDPSGIVAADLDRDGDKDLIVAGSNFIGTITVLPNGGKVTLPPAADLTVTNASVLPASVYLGDTVRIDYSVKNIGQSTAAGKWIDSIFLSKDDRLDPSDKLLTRVTHVGDLTPGASYDQSIQAIVPAFSGFVPGDWQVLVRTNTRSDIREQSATNNTLSAPIAIDQQITTLTLGVPFDGTIAAGQSLYYQVDYAKGQALAFTLTGLPTSGTVELYVKRDGLPGTAAFDRAGNRPFAGEQYIVLPAQATAGTYYILVHAPTLASSPASFRLTAEVPVFGIRSTQFGTAGNAGDFTVRAAGTNLDGAITARLRNAQGFDLAAKSYYNPSAAEIYVTFDLRGVAPGTYDVVFENAAGDTVTIPQGLRVVASASSEAVVPHMIAPSRIRRGSLFSFTVEWENTSMNDVAAPLLTVGAPVPFGTKAGDSSLGTRYTFLGTNTKNGPAGILRPGQRESITFWAQSDTEVGTYSLFVDRVIKDPTAPFDWAAAIAFVQPAAMTPDEVASVADTLEQTYGGNAGGYLHMLAGTADATWQDPRDPDGLLQEEVIRVWSRLTSGLWGSVLPTADQPDGGYAVTANETSSGAAITTRTDRFGRFHFTDLPDGTYTLSIPGEVTTVSGGNSFAIAAAGSVGPINVSVIDVPDITFQIDLLDGDPIASATVVILKGEVPVGGGVTDDEGVATATGVEPGTYTLVIGLLEGGVKVIEGVVIPPSGADVIEIDLASATLRGTLPATAGLYPVLVSTGAKVEVVHATVNGTGFDLRAAAGDYRLLIFGDNGNQLADLGVFTLADGAQIDVGLIAIPVQLQLESNLSLFSGTTIWFDDPIVGLGTHMVDGPPSALALIDINVIGLRDPDLVELLVAPFVLWGTGLVRGAEYVSVVRQFVDGGGYRSFSDGSETVESGGGVNPGFRNHRVTEFWVNGLLTYSAEELKKKVDSKEVELDCGESRPFEIKDLLSTQGDDAKKLLYQDGNNKGSRPLTFGDTLAGGVGHYGTPPSYAGTPDKRELDAGQAILTRNTHGKYEVELKGVKLHVHDAFDFWPGSLGLPLLTRYGTTVLAFLEINGRAGDVVFDVTWEDQKERKVELGIGEECDPCESKMPPDDCKKVERPTSFDPNDITGPAGYGPDNYIVATDVMPYTIRFENDAKKATAPAAVVSVTQTLDADLDWTTFRLGDLGFGNTVVDVPDDVAFYDTRVDATATLGVYVEISAGIDTATGKVHWQFTAIDPATGDIPADPLVGFLLPNVNSPEGEGFVTYIISPRQGVVSGHRVDAVAEIVFDVNEPIITPEIYHTFDTGLPTSSVQPLPAVVGKAAFTVAWTGQDDVGGSGVATYDIFVSENQGPYTLWQNDIATKSATFTGVNGHTYSFYSVATDGVGFVEPIPVAAQATTLITVQNGGGGGGGGGATDTSPPSSPGALRSSGLSPTSVTMNWSPSNDDIGVFGYTVYFRQAGSSQYAVAGQTSATTLEITLLEPGTEYEFYVIARDDAGNSSAPSAIVAITTLLVPDTEPPTAPTGLAVANVSSNAVTLTWQPATDNNGIARYVVFGRLSGPVAATFSVALSGAFSEVAEATGTTVEVNNLEPGTGYEFYVVAEDVAGNTSPQSTPVLITTEAAPLDNESPTAPANLSASNVTNTGLNLSWMAATDNVGVSEYTVYFRVAGSGSFASAGKLGGTSFAVTSLEPGTEYEFYVEARDAAGNVSLPSATLSATTEATPSVVTRFIAVGTSDGSVRLVNADDGAVILSGFSPLDSGGVAYTGIVSVALGDVNGDGVADLFIAAASPLGEKGLDASKAGRVFVYDGATLLSGDTSAAPIRSITPFATSDSQQTSTGLLPVNTTYTNGLNIAAADVNGDGVADLIAGTRGGIPTLGLREYGRFVVINGDTMSQIGNIVKPFGTGYEKGIVVAGLDVGGDGKAEVAVTRGGPVASTNPNKSNKLKLYQLSGASLNELNLTGTDAVLAPFSDLGRDGRITGVDTNGDGKQELVFSALDRSANNVRVIVYGIAASAAAGTPAATVVSTGSANGAYTVGAGVTDHAITSTDRNGDGSNELAILLDANVDQIAYFATLSGNSLGGFNLPVLTGGVTIDAIG